MTKTLLDLRMAEFAAQMQECIELNDDPEVAHNRADEVLCDALIELGQQELVKLYAKVRKWYA